MPSSAENGKQNLVPENQFIGIEPGFCRFSITASRRSRHIVRHCCVCVNNDQVQLSRGELSAQQTALWLAPVLPARPVRGGDGGNARTQVDMFYSSASGASLPAARDNHFDNLIGIGQHPDE